MELSHAFQIIAEVFVFRSRVCEELMLYGNIVGAVIFGPFQVWQCSLLKFGYVSKSPHLHKDPIH